MKKRRRCSEKIDLVNLFGMRGENDNSANPVGEQFPGCVHEAFGPNKFLVMVAMSGSDALSHLCHMAKLHALRVHRHATEARILTFDRGYGAGRGPMMFRSDRLFILEKSQCPTINSFADIIPAPWTRTSHMTLTASERPLTHQEVETITRIEQEIRTSQNSSCPVGAIIFESMHSTGKWSLHPSFLRSLCELGLRTKVLVFEDACMTSVRCGEFLPEDSGRYLPDAVAMAKVWGMGLVLADKRSRLLGTRLHSLSGLVTSACDGEILRILTAKADKYRNANFLKRIKDAGTRIRDHLLTSPGVEVEGAGLLIYTNARISNATYSYSRLLPALDITNNQIDALKVTGVT